MSNSDPANVLRLLERALSLTAEDRSAFLDTLDRTDPALRQELVELLRADEAARDFLQPLPVEPMRRDGEIVGPWRLGNLLGRGGMGEVYLAERIDGLYQGRAAVKFLRFNLGEHGARFANERRILAGLRHPNVARLIDAGRDHAGAPYVVMDYVDGEPIDRHCQRQALSVRACIELFLRVLDAVQYAHTNLIVHRDLKPANILIDQAGQPRLLDFGIAKLLDDVDPALTGTGMLALTPEYASPEQVQGGAIGTTSDIYALGVVLFELLTGQRPYSVASTAPADMMKAVCESEPPLPSRVAQARGLRIDRDLDHVLLKALAKAPAQRYQDCSQFGDDLRRYLDGHAVRAVEAGRAYRTRKFVVRHGFALGLGLLVAIGLLSSAAIAWMQAADAREQATIASQERERTQRLNAVLERVITAPSPLRRGRSVTVVELLDDSVPDLESRLGDDPLLLASVLTTLARSYNLLGRGETTTELVDKVEAIVDAHPDADTVSERIYLSSIMSQRGEVERAHRHLLHARRLHGGIADEQGALIENELAGIALFQHDLPRAGEHYQRALAIVRGMDPRPKFGLSTVLDNLANVYAQQGRFQDAVAHRKEALQHSLEDDPDRKSYPVLTLLALAGDYESLGAIDEAEPMYRQVIEQLHTLFEPSHPFVLRAHTELAWLLVNNGRADEAEPLARLVWERGEPQLPIMSREAAGGAAILGAVLIELDRPDEAEPLLQRALDLRLALHQPDHPLVAYTQAMLAHARILNGESDAAMPDLLAAIEMLEQRLGLDSPRAVLARKRLQRVSVVR